MLDNPYFVDLVGAQLSRHDICIRRTLGSLRGQFADEAAYQAALAREDTPLYEVYEMVRPNLPGELLFGLTVLHPGKVGGEYYMTKGHFHAVLETAEIYTTLQGRGMLVMENPDGNSAVMEFLPGRTLYIPPQWAHRSVNTGSQDLVFSYIYPAHSGHDYGTIEQHGFRKRVIDVDGEPTVIDNSLYTR